MMDKIIALDLDGTLLTGRKELTPQGVRALMDSAREGCQIVIATGRPYYGIPDEVLSLPCIRFVISSNGAVIYDCRAQKQICHAYLQPSHSQRILDIVRNSGRIYTVFSEGVGWTDPKTYEQIMDRFKGTPLLAYMKKSRRVLEDDRKIVDRLENIWFRSPDEQDREDLLSQIGQDPGFQVIRSGFYDAELLDPGADKGKALDFLAGYCGIGREQIMAIGDDANDETMLLYAGYPVAMENATPRVKALARHVTRSNEEDGVAEAIRSLIMEKKVLEKEGSI